jgi:DNA gyrase subunit B
LADFLERNPQDAKAIIEKCVLSQKARKAAKAAKDTVLRKGILEGLALPGKLSDCTSRKAEECEIFLVEGDSAGGSTKQARDRFYQAVLPLRGKILNVERARLDKMLESKEIKSLIIAMGTAIGDDFDIEKARYHKIIIMCDADSDGNHIQDLAFNILLSSFQTHYRQGYVYIAQPPLYKIQSGKEI